MRKKSSKLKNIQLIPSKKGSLLYRYNMEKMKPTTNTVIKNPARAKYQTPFTKLYFSSYLKNAI